MLLFVQSGSQASAAADWHSCLNAAAPARCRVSCGRRDAVISVNAIDHVSDFSAVAKEIRRVLKPGGTLRLQAHYHKPTPLEPQSLDDELILREFGSLGVRKVAERRVKPGEQVHDFDECLVVWANDIDVMPSTTA